MRYMYKLYEPDIDNWEPVSDWLDLKGEYANREEAQKAVQRLTTLPYSLREE